LSSGIVVDANVMSEFTQALIRDEATAARSLIDSIRVTHGFAIDKKGQIEQQWRNTCGNQYFGEWLVQALKDGAVRMVDTTPDAARRKKLHTEYGFPRAGYEFTYVAVAVSAPPHYIVTDDIDFWEPKYKTAPAATKTATKQGRKGAVYKYLTKKMGVRVGTIEQAISDHDFDNPNLIAP